MRSLGEIDTLAHHHGADEGWESVEHYLTVTDFSSRQPFERQLRSLKLPPSFQGLEMVELYIKEKDARHHTCVHSSPYPWVSKGYLGSHRPWGV